MRTFLEVIAEANKLNHQVKKLLDSHKFYKELAEKRGKALEMALPIVEHQSPTQAILIRDALGVET